MKKKRILKGLLLLALCSMSRQSIYAQELYLNPTQTVYELATSIPTYNCPVFDVNGMRKEDSINMVNRVTPTRFAKKFELNITPRNAGIWEDVGDVKVWRYKITSNDAYSMMVMFKDLKLPEDASLFVYNEDMSYISGPFTAGYNANNVLATELIPGGSIIVEMVCDARYTRDAYFNIASVSHDYWNVIGVISGNGKDKHSMSILNCHKDINCPEGSQWQNHKRSVARIVIDGNALCTGASINNTNFDGKSYFLTANHCYLGNANDVNNSVFYFNYEKQGCGGSAENGVYTISGASLKSYNGYSDFALLELNSRVPSSYYPYLSGWDKGPGNLLSGTIIHHPGGNVKKISIDNDNVSPNTATVNFGPSLTFVPNTAWEVSYQVGTTEGGSSGGPLFNDKGRIVGQLGGGQSGCTITDWFGRFSMSWAQGGSNTSRLREWLDPRNTNATEILGYMPAGWRHDWLTGWNQPAAHKIHTQIKSIAVGEGNQVFYRGADNKMQLYYFNNSNNTWVHDWVRGWNIPNHELIAGDVVVGEGNQVFYRGTDGKIHVYYWDQNNGWIHDWLTGWNSPSYENISAQAGSLSIGVGNQLFYRGTDDKMHVYYWTQNNGWQHGWIVNGAPNNQNVAGDIVVGTAYGHNQVFYRGTDGKMHVYYFNASTNLWVHDYLTGWNSPSHENVHATAGSITVGEDNQIFYRGTDNKMHVYYFDHTLGTWHHGWMINGAGNDQNVSGNLSVGEGNQLFYRGTDGKMHIYWFNTATNLWVHDWIENSWQAPSLHNVSGSIDVGEGNQVFYRGNDGLCRVYFFGQAAMMRPAENKNYGMDQVKASRTVPKYAALFEVSSYPNPVQDAFNLNVNSPADDQYTVSLTDVTGKVLLSENRLLKKGFNTINYQAAATMTSGVYIISIMNTNTKEMRNIKLSKL
jgi:hypothetical protein